MREKSVTGRKRRCFAGWEAALRAGEKRKEEDVMAQERKKRSQRFYDYSLLFAIVFLTIFGLIMIYSSSSYKAQIDHENAAYFMIRQGAIAAVGLVLMIIISKMDYHWYAKVWKLGALVVWILMILVTFTSLGREYNGKKRWLGYSSFSFQPSELVKILVIVALASMIVRYGKDIDRFAGKFRVMLLVLPLAMIVVLNNLSTGIIIVGIGFVMMFVASKEKWPYVLCVAAAAFVLVFAGPIGRALTGIGLLHDYQLGRINVWLDPESYSQEGGFQVLQGLYAIGSGGLFGKGLGQSIQKMGFVPEAQNDMIFSIICEELGLFGAISLILIFMFMIYRFMVIASNAPDLFGSMLVVGVMGHIAIQVILNIAVVTNTIPNTGITLPFISYGGTSVLFLLIEMGMVLSVSNQIKLEK